MAGQDSLINQYFQLTKLKGSSEVVFILKMAVIKQASPLELPGNFKYLKDKYESSLWAECEALSTYFKSIY